MREVRFPELKDGDLFWAFRPDPMDGAVQENERGVLQMLRHRRVLQTGG